MWIEVLLSVLILWLLWNTLKKPSNYPPGLWGVPLFGYIPFSLRSFDATFRELKKKHGDIFCWRMGSKVIVFLCDFKMVKETYHSVPFADRPPLQFMSMLVDKMDLGVTLTNGTHWHNIRRFTLRHLRDMGMGKSKMEYAVQYEAMEFVKELKKQAGKPTPLTRALKPATLNVLWQMVANKRFELNEKEFVEFDTLIHKLQDNFTRFVLQDIFPWVLSVFPKKLQNILVKIDAQNELSDEAIRIFENYIKEHAGTLDKNNPRDFIDAYLIEMEKQKSDPQSKMSTTDLVACISDLFAAGSETTTATVYWAIFYMALFPEIQSKLQKEVDAVLPNETLASLDDRSRLPYTEAFINEVLRFSALTKFGIPRTVLSDIKLAGYTIPKDAIILSAAESLHFDPAYFDSPKEFVPERFLNADGKIEIPKAGFLPFGIGKRQCIGESLARMELLIFITTIVKYIHFPPNKEVDIRPLEIPVFNQPRIEQKILLTIRK